MRAVVGRHAPLSLAEEQGALPNREPRQALVNVARGYLGAGQVSGREGAGSRRHGQRESEVDCLSGCWILDMRRTPFL